MNEDIIKDKEQTMKKLLVAFDKILIEEGFQKLGINKIAKKAGVSKVLIYRYFNNFDGLLAAYLEQKAFWLAEGKTDIELLKTMAPNDIRMMAIQVFHGLFDTLWQNIEQQEIKRWELLECNEVIKQIGDKIEAPVNERNSVMAQILGVNEREIAGVIGILIGGIYYLVLRSKTLDRFNGIELQTYDGHQLIKDSITLIINSLIK